jgi:hypothetical protein
MAADEKENVNICFTTTDFCILCNIKAKTPGAAIRQSEEREVKCGGEVALGGSYAISGLNLKQPPAFCVY